MVGSPNTNAIVVPALLVRHPSDPSGEDWWRYGHGYTTPYVLQPPQQLGHFDPRIVSQLLLSWSRNPMPRFQQNGTTHPERMECDRTRLVANVPTSSATFGSLLLSSSPTHIISPTNNLTYVATGQVGFPPSLLQKSGLHDKSQHASKCSFHIVTSPLPGLSTIGIEFCGLQLRTRVQPSSE